MKMTNMTAVEWLVKQICGKHTEAWHEEIQQALEMEKQQIIYAHLAGQNSADEIDGKNEFVYYKNTFGNGF